MSKARTTARTLAALKELGDDKYRLARLLAAVPRRPLVLAAKSAVIGAVTLSCGEVLALARSSPGRQA